MNVRTLIATALLCALVNPASAQVTSSRKAEKGAHATLTKVKWHRTLEAAKEVAQSEGKPIFWLQLVGDLDDGL